MWPLLDLSPRSLLLAPVYPSSTWGLFVLHGAHVSILVDLRSCSALTQYHSWICAVALATAVLPGARPGWSLLPESAITAAVFKCLRGPRGPLLGHRLLLSRTAWADRGHSHNPRDSGHHLLHAEAAAPGTQTGSAETQMSLLVSLAWSISVCFTIRHFKRGKYFMLARLQIFTVYEI